MCSTGTVAASVLATHYVDLTSADAEAMVAERLRDTGLIIFNGLAGRRSVLAFANALQKFRQEVQPFIRLILTLDQGELAILVRDFCTGTPQPGNAGADDESGRGLFLVQSMSNRFGWSPADDASPGKVVWAVVCPE